MKNENEFEYDNDEAANVILQNISTDLENKLDFEDIVKILELKDEYFKKVGIIPEDDKESVCDYPIELDQEAMNLFIITNAVRDNIILTIEEMVEIMDAEVIYLEINDQLEDPTHLN